MMTATTLSDDELRQAAKKRVARLIKVSSDDLSLDAVFGEDIKASFVSDFKLNELDILLEDIHDVADKQTEKELNSGTAVIRTVGDYCEHMVRCYRTKPKEVARILSE